MNTGAVRKFFSIPRFQKDYNEADQTTGLIGYTVIMAVFTGFFYIPAVSRVTGLAPAEWLIVIGIHITFDLLPYYAFKKLYMTPAYALGVNILPLGLACLLIFFTEDARSPLWGFFFLYAGVLGNLSHSNIYYSLAVFVTPLLTGVAFHSYGHFPDPASDWLALSLMAFLGMCLYLYAGFTNDKWRDMALKNAELEKIVAMEGERNRLSREIHDGLGSSFTSAIMLTDMLGRERAEQGGGKDDRITDLKALLEEGLGELRVIIWTTEGEAAALGDLFSRIVEKFGNAAAEPVPRITAEIGNKALPVSPLMMGNVMRIIQEALNNIRKHAAATEISILIQEQDGRMKVAITDNGRGFDVSAARVMSGHGLRNMKKRCEQLGAEFAVNSAPGQGTELVMRFGLSPLPRPRPGN